jgi:hypothetical protein
MVFGRDPAIIIEFVKALLLVVSVTLVPVSTEVQAGLVAVLVAASGVFKAFSTRDKVTGRIAVGPTVFTELIVAVGALLLSFGVELGPEVVASVVALAGAGVVMLQRQALTPAVPGRVARR